MDEKDITNSLQALHSSTHSLHELNMLLNAEVKALRAFCVALAQNMPDARLETHAAFALLCGAFRPDEAGEPSAAERFDAISQLLSTVLLAPPGSLPPIPPRP